MMGEQIPLKMPVVVITLVGRQLLAMRMTVCDSSAETQAGNTSQA